MAYMVSHNELTHPPQSDQSDPYGQILMKFGGKYKTVIDENASENGVGKMAAILSESGMVDE